MFPYPKYWFTKFLFIVALVTHSNLFAFEIENVTFYRLPAAEIQSILHQMQADDIYSLDFVFLAANGFRSSITIPYNRVAKVLSEGFVSDGATINLNHNSKVGDIKLKPVLNTYRKIVTGENNISAQIICDVFYVDNAPLDCYSRYVLQKAIDKYAALALVPKIGVELEFVLLKKVNCDACKCHSYVSYDEEVYATPSLNADHRKIIKSIMSNLEQSGVPIEKFHHESGIGQHEVSLVYDSAMTLVDNMVTAMYIIKATADHYGLIASFMPKVFSGKSSPNCLHMNMSLADINGRNLFFDNQSENKLSELGMNFLSGIVQHAPDITLLFSSTINSYKRIASGRAAPQYSCYGVYNKSTMIRVPLITEPGEARIEMRAPDSLSNIYLATAAILTAGLYGIESKTAAPEPITQNLFQIGSEEIAKLNIQPLPYCMYDAISLFEKSDFNIRFLGESTVKALARNAYKEIDRFNNAITDWELDEYL